MGSRPNFQLPFKAGVAVTGKTYAGHGPDDKKIDFYVDGSHIGAEVVASAAGVVHEWFDPGGMEINHGNGWFTVYLHMTDRVPVGARVPAGGFIGRLGSVGTGYPHLHYEQLYTLSGDAGSGDIVNPVLQGIGPIIMDPKKPFTMVSANGAANVDMRLGADEMLVLVKRPGKPEVYLANGMTRRQVPGEQALKDIRWLASQGAIGPLWQDGKIWEGENLDAFGLPV